MSRYMSATGVAAAKAGTNCTIYISKEGCEAKEGEACYFLNHEDPRKVNLVANQWELDSNLEASVDSADSAYASQQAADQANLDALITKLKSLEADLNAASSLSTAKPIIIDGFKALIKHLKI